MNFIQLIALSIHKSPYRTMFLIASEASIIFTCDMTKSRRSGCITENIQKQNLCTVHDTQRISAWNASFRTTTCWSFITLKTFSNNPVSLVNWETTSFHRLAVKSHLSRPGRKYGWSHVSSNEQKFWLMKPVIHPPQRSHGCVMHARKKMAPRLIFAGNAASNALPDQGVT